MCKKKVCLFYLNKFFSFTFSLLSFKTISKTLKSIYSSFTMVTKATIMLFLW